MKRWICWIGVLLILLLGIQGGFASSTAREELSGRGEERPVAILTMEEGIYVAFQEPGRLVSYDHEWVEKRMLDLPEDFQADEMIVAGQDLWILDGQRGTILQIDPEELQVIQSHGDGFSNKIEAIFETDEIALLLDEKGYVHQVDENFSVLRWMSGLKLYQAAFYDGNHVYLGGRVRPGETGILVKTVGNKLEDEWLMSDDSRAPAEVDVVEQIRLLPDGYFYVVYRDTGIVKYDEYGNYRNRIYQRKGEAKVFRDIAMSSENGTYYMVDQAEGIFEVKWSRDRRISIKKAQVNTSGLRLSTRSVMGLTTVQVGEGKLSSFYQTDGTKIQIRIPSRDVERLKLRISVADLMEAQVQNIERMEIRWKEETYSFDISEWVLALREEEKFEEQYIEININSEQIVIDKCWVERLDEKTKTVRRENLE